MFLKISTLYHSDVGKRQVSPPIISITPQAKKSQKQPISTSREFISPLNTKHFLKNRILLSQSKEKKSRATHDAKELPRIGPNQSMKQRNCNPSLEDLSMLKRSSSFTEIIKIQRSQPGSKQIRRMQTILDLKHAAKVQSFDKLNAFAIPPETQIKLLTNTIDINLRKIRHNSHQVEQSQSKFSKNFDVIQHQLSEETFNPTLDQKTIFYMVREKNRFNEKLAWLLTWMIADKNRVLALLDARNLVNAESKFQEKN